MIAADRLANTDADRPLADLLPMPKILLVVIALSCLSYIALSMNLPVALFADAGFDDDLFVQHAQSIVSGHWLGPYSQMTLAKGVGYPLFLALNAILGVPITLSQALLYCGACIIMTRLVFRISGSAWVALCCFIAMQWHPAGFPARIIRDDISASQVLLLLAAASHCIFLPIRFRLRLAWAICAGIMLGWFWLTREDAIWVIPGLLALFSLQSLQFIRSRREVLRLAGCACLLFLTTAATLGAIAAINFSYYGTFTTVDFKQKDFAKALTALQTVRVGNPVPFVPVPANARHAIDKVSPAFASLEPFLNGVGRGWMKPGCDVYPSTCGDFAGGWFMWALRDAAAWEGHYKSPQTAAKFYRQIWQQVGAACHSGQLQCRANPIPLMPAVTAGQWSQVPSKIVALYHLAAWYPASAQWQYQARFNPSTGDFGQLREMTDFLNSPKRTNSAWESAPVSISGWYRPTSNDWIELRCATNDGETTLSLNRMPSPDLVGALHDPKVQTNRFSMTVTNLRGCYLETVGDKTTAEIALSDLRSGVMPLGSGELGIDHVLQITTSHQSGLRLFRFVNWVYSHVLPTATAISGVVFLVTIIWRLFQRDPNWINPITIVVTTIWILLAARGTVLILVDISSFPAIDPFYWGAGFPLLCLAVVLSLSMPFLRSRLPASASTS